MRHAQPLSLESLGKARHMPDVLASIKSVKCTLCRSTDWNNPTPLGIGPSGNRSDSQNLLQHNSRWQAGAEK